MKLLPAETRFLLANLLANPLPLAETIANLIVIEPCLPSLHNLGAVFISLKQVTILWFNCQAPIKKNNR